MTTNRIESIEALTARLRATLASGDTASAQGRIASLIDELRLLSQDLDDSHPIDTGLPMWGLERSSTTVERSR